MFCQLLRIIPLLKHESDQNFQDVLAMAGTKINQKNQDILLVKLPSHDYVMAV
jgi:hypothetical protein